jgi:preprotein translocase subunit SecA
MRMFGSERIAKIMDRMGIKEGEVIQHSMITKSIERAQKKVEENNFGIRKKLLEYDDVMNAQREVIYKKRKHALFGERLAIDISNMMYDAIEQTVLDFQDSRDFEGFKMEMLKVFAFDPPYDEKNFLDGKKDEIIENIFEKVYENYRQKNDQIREKALPVIKDVFEDQNNQYENIAIPITDGIKEMQVVANLKRANENEGQEVILAIEKGVTLSQIDNAWKEHLRELDDLKQSVQTATYEQKDPLLIYKFESFELFKSMVQRTNKEIDSFLVKCHLPGAKADVRQAQQHRRTDMSKYKTERSDLLSQAHSDTQAEQITQPVTREKKVGRNDPCPCGSGKKYKNCHGKKF